jgi:putative chitinase
MRLRELLSEVKIDNKQGAGAVPFNQEIDYFGLRTTMRPSTFLRLAAPLGQEHSAELEQYIANGGAIGAPFLEIKIPPEWDDGDFSKPAQVAGHEGRNRMTAVKKLEGDAPIEVHILPRGGYRARDITPEFKAALAKSLYAEKSTNLVSGPLFESGLEEGWRDTLANVAIAGGIAAGGMGGMMAKQAATDHFNAPQTAVTQTSQAKTPKVPTSFAQAKSAPSAPAALKAPQKIDVKAITNNPLEATLLKVAKSSGLDGAELAAFMAQCAHETLDFKRLTEFGGSLDFRKYDPKYAPKKAKALGNKVAGDGAKYKGRGFIQITGRYNYKRAGQELGLDLVKHPELAEDPATAAKIAVWFWKHRVQPNVDNFKDTTVVTKQINPGMRGLENRKDNFAGYMQVALK